MEQTEQTLKKLTHMLPDTICIESEKREADNVIRKAVQDLQGAYKGLAHIEELAPLSTCISDFTEEWVNGKVEKRTELVVQDLSLTEEERKKRLASWWSVKARATRYINTIKRVLNEWPCASWAYDGLIENFYCNNIDDVVRAMSTHAVSDEAKDHYLMVWQCINLVRELRRWEDEHNVKSQNLADLQCMTAEAFAEMWVDGCVKFDTTTALRYGFVVGNPHDPKHPERTII